MEMKQLPEALLRALTDTTGFSREAFEQVHRSGEQVTFIRLNPFKLPDMALEERVPWTEYGYYLEKRPSFTFDPLFHAGCYYVQEASSMFLEQALKQSTDLSLPLRVLDLSAAPGGKSTHLLSLLSGESLLVSNEVIRSRAQVLRDNIVKWGCANAMVTNNDPGEFKKLENFFDIMVVDAPCSGSGLFRRDPGAIAEWSPQNVIHCSQRQQRILADAWPALKKEGLLVYSTCSYSSEEDEDIVKWLTEEFLAEPVRLSLDPSWKIIESGGGYRFWPDKVRGEGFFIACLRKKSGGEAPAMRSKQLPQSASSHELDVLGKWMNTGDYFFARHLQSVYAWPIALRGAMNQVLQQMRVLYSGVLVGEFFHHKLVPDHALAMSGLGRGDAMELDLENAILYLQRKEIMMEPGKKGWQRVNYEGFSLGWVNALPGRINNYYPKQLRILKEDNPGRL